MLKKLSDGIQSKIIYFNIFFSLMSVMKIDINDSDISEHSKAERKESESAPVKEEKKVEPPKEEPKPKPEPEKKVAQPARAPNKNYGNLFGAPAKKN